MSVMNFLPSKHFKNSSSPTTSRLWFSTLSLTFQISVFMTSIHFHSPLPSSHSLMPSQPLMQHHSCLVCNRPSRNVCWWFWPQSPTSWPHHSSDLPTVLTSSCLLLIHYIYGHTWTLINTWKYSISKISILKNGLLIVILTPYLFSITAHSY